jgi:AraC-like DNA-binding protein
LQDTLMADSTVSASLFGGLLDMAVAKGADRELLMHRAGIVADALLDRDNRIPLANYVALFRAGKELCGDPALGLHYGEAVDLADISVVGLIGEASATLTDALLQLNRYGKLVIDVALPGQRRFETVPYKGGFWTVDRRVDPDAFPELTEATFARMICGIRRFAPDLRVEEVHVTHPAPAHAAEYKRVLGAPVVFDSHWNAYRADAKWLTYRLNLQPGYVFGILRSHADRLIEDMERPASFRQQVESQLLTVIHTGQFDMVSIARALGLSRQTLYRRLNAEGTTFDHVLDALRHKLAVQYLRGAKVSVNETAYLVGFADPAAFSRAFKRWTGQNPRSFRASSLASRIPGDTIAY